MRPTPASDAELLEAAAGRLRASPETLMRRYYASGPDALHELEQLGRTGRLQASFAALLRAELARLERALETSPAPDTRT